MLTRFFLSIVSLGISAGIMAQENIPYQDISQRSSRRTEERAKERTSSRNTNQTQANNATNNQNPNNRNNNQNNNNGNNNGNNNNRNQNDDGPKGLTVQEKNTGTATRKVTTTNGNNATTGSKTVARPDAKKSNKAASQSSGSSGQIVEVNEGMLQALRTQTVEFDPDAMAETEGIIMLNPRKYESDGKKRRSGGIAQPL